MYFVTVVVPLLIFITIIITIHELGHFLAAKKFGVAVHTFSIGFGPIIFKRVDKSGVTWQIAAIPLGGYVRMASLDLLDIKLHTKEITQERYDELKPLCMDGVSYIKRIIIALAGPLANILTAFLLLIVINVTPKSPILYKVLCVTPNSPAMEAGIKKGNIIRFIDGSRDADSRKFELYDSNSKLIKQSEVAREKLSLQPCITELENNKPANFDNVEYENFIANLNNTVDNEGGLYSGIIIVPELSTIDGIEKERANFIDATKSAFTSTVKFSLFIYSEVVKKIVTLDFSEFRSLGGFAQQVEATQKVSQASSSAPVWAVYVLLIVNWSLIIGTLNLLPIPVLDGGHVVIATLETIRKKRFSIATRSKINIIGMLILLILFLIAVNNDFTFMS